MSADKGLEQKLLLDILSNSSETREDIAEIKTEIVAIKENLAEHMRRTKLAEDRVTRVEAKTFKMEGAVLLVGIIATIAGIYRALHG